MKKYNTLLVIIFTILFVTLLTWLLPITYLNGEFVSAPRSQVGITELFNYPIFTFYNFIYVLVYLLAIGGFYGVLHKTSAYRVMLDKIVNFIKGKELVFFIPTVLLLAVIVSFTGFTFEALIFLPFIASIIFMLGYDKITVALTTIGSVVAGVIGSTFSALIAGTFNDMLSINYTDLWIAKVALLVLSSCVVIMNVILHNRKVERNDKVQENIFVPSKVSAGKVKVWPLITILTIFTIILVMSTVAWKDAFGIEFFTTSLSKLLAYKVLSKYVVLTVSILVLLDNVIRYVVRRAKAKKAKNNHAECSVGKLLGKTRIIVTSVFGVIAVIVLAKIFLEDVFEVTNVFTKLLKTLKLNTIVNNFTFGTLFGAVKEFGSWTYNEYILFVLITSTVIMLVYRIKLSDAFDGYGNGVKTYLYAAMISIFAYTVLILTSNHPVILTMLKPLLTITNGFNNLTLSIGTFVSALFNTDFTYYQYGVLTLNYVTSYITDTSVYPLCALITQGMSGLAMLVAPTSVVMLFSLTTLKITYWEWLKNVWRMFVELLVVLLITFTVVLLII